MILTVDIGNTIIAVGGFEGDMLAFVVRLATNIKETSHEYAAKLAQHPAPLRYGDAQLNGSRYLIGRSAADRYDTRGAENSIRHRCALGRTRCQDRYQHTLRRSIVGRCGSYLRIGRGG